jgi:GNAT superfamily N-acetyltransferase
MPNDNTERRFTTLGLHTDVALLEMEGSCVTDCGAFTSIVSPHNPTHFWGNFLIFRDAPAGDVLDEWESLFDRHVGSTSHRSFTWDSQERGEIDQFTGAGYDVELAVTLALPQESIVMPPRWNDEIEIRECASADDWNRSVELSVLTRDAGHDEEFHRRFARARVRAREELIRRGVGAWFGAWLDNVLVGELGVFDTGGGIGRFQSVTTHPGFRRLGICSTLVHHASTWAFENLAVDQLVMVADSEYHAARIYESVGFKPVETWTCAEWWVRTETE